MQTKTILIKNGQVVSPKDRINEKRDVLIVKGRIAALKKNIKEKAARVIDARGLYVCPGFIDMHVHLREPGFEDKETIISGTDAAAAGGITAVAAMPNTSPLTDNNAVVKFILERAKAAKARVYPVGTITAGMGGKNLSEIGLMREAGIVAISEDGLTVMDSSVMKNAIRYCKMDDTLIICHCEDMDLARGGVMNEGKVSSVLGLQGIPKAAEEIIVTRDLMLAKDTGARIHIAHVSTKGSVDLIRQAKKEKVRVTAETAPHYFTLTDEVIKTFNPNCKMNPPLREKEDVSAITQGLRDGTIDAIATDHAPHTVDDKDKEFDQTPNGVVGLETSIGIVLTALVQKKKISFGRMVELMSANPSRILGVEGGSLKTGSRADLTIINSKKKWKVNPDQFQSKGRNTPFAGKNLVGKAVVTIVDGEVVFEEASK
jgi:dihydroorotase